MTRSVSRTCVVLYGLFLWSATPAWAQAMPAGGPPNNAARPASAGQTAAALLAHLTSPGPGWTALKPAADTRIIYVSSSSGNDANEGLSPDAPLKSIARGFDLLRNDHSDWLLLRRGDTWHEPLGSVTAVHLKNGRSRAQPTVIASYGDTGPRPLLKLGDHRAGLSVALNRPYRARNMAVVGVHFYDEKGDPDSKDFVKDRAKRAAGIDWKAPGEGLLIEDCRFEYLTAGVIVGKSPWKGTPADVLRDVRIRRCVATHAWSTSGHCQGFFVNAVDGILFEENVLDHNGYCYRTGDVPTWFNHNVYITIRCDHVIARGNIIARGSTTGFYCRTNGILEDNLCLDNCPSLNLGRITPARPGGVTGRIARNVIIGTAVRDTPQKKGLTGPGIELANINRGGAIVEDNILIGEPTLGAAAIQVGGVGVGAHNVIVRGNTVCNWAPAFRCFGTAGKQLLKGMISGLEIQDNQFVAPEGYQGALIEEMRGPTGMVCHGNTCYAPSGTVGMGLTNNDQPPDFVDRTRNLATYHRALGRAATRTAFLIEAAKQSKFNWRGEYTARTVNAYIRAGFKLRP